MKKVLYFIPLFIFIFSNTVLPKGGVTFSQWPKSQKVVKKSRKNEPTNTNSYHTRENRPSGVQLQALQANVRREKTNTSGMAKPCLVAGVCVAGAAALYASTQLLQQSF